MAVDAEQKDAGELGTDGVQPEDVSTNEAPPTGAHTAVNSPRGGHAGARVRRAGDALKQRPRAFAGAVAIVLIGLILTPLLAGIGHQHPPVTAQIVATTTATDVPTATTTPDPHALDWVTNLHTAAENAYVTDMIAHMSVDEEIGQMLMIEFLDTQMTPTIAAELNEFHVGGVVLYRWNVTSADGLRALDADLQATSKVPLLIATDQEGGSVNRLAFMDGYRPGAEEMGLHNDPAFVRQRGQTDGQQLYTLGINMNYAPVVDVQGVPDGQTVMSGRMFGWTPTQVTQMAGAYLGGLQQDHHVVGTLKHFPGIGSVVGDPHQGSIVLSRSIDDMERADWAPYRALLATGQVEVIMTTHVTLPSVDPNLPTTLSPAITTGLLRDRLGFQGVIVTDGIYMHALADHFPFDQIIVGSILAGNDLISSTYSYDSTARAVQAIQRAVASGQISKQRLDESVRRILYVKLHYGLLSMKAHG